MARRTESYIRRDSIDYREIAVAFDFELCEEVEGAEGFLAVG